MAGIWIPIAQYAGFSIYKEEDGLATKLLTPEGEVDLVQGKRVHFVNPNTGSPNFAFPEVLLARAEKGNGPSAPKEKKVKEPKKSLTAKAEEIIERSEKKAKGEIEIIGYLVPDLTPLQVAEEPFISCPPVFSSEKGAYKKNRVFATIPEAKDALFNLYGRRQ